MLGQPLVELHRAFPKRRVVYFQTDRDDRGPTSTGYGKSGRVSPGIHNAHTGLEIRDLYSAIPDRIYTFSGWNGVVNTAGGDPKVRGEIGMSMYNSAVERFIRLS